MNKQKKQVCTLSICVIAYNEEAFLPNLLENIEQQTYPHEYIEVVLIDGMSTDKTKAIMQEFQQKDNGFYSVQVLDNPKRIQAAGWNVAIRNFTGDALARIDAHTQLTPDFSKYVMEDLQEGENIVGGIRPCLIEGDTAWANVLLQTENSLFGSSINVSRRGLKKTYVKTFFHATYRREVLEKVGLLNEELLRTEDNELHWRMRQAGYRFCYDPRIVSYQYARGNFRAMMKQKYGNGYWIGLTLGVCPGCISLYHLIPFAFVSAIIATSLLACLGIWQLAALMWALYGLFAVGNTVISAVQNKFYVQTILMPFLFFVLHISYGVGTFIGLIKLPVWKKRYKKNRERA